MLKTILHHFEVLFRAKDRNGDLVRLVKDVIHEYGMVWYGMVTLFKHGISFRYTFIEKTNFLTSLKTKSVGVANKMMLNYGPGT